jgi:hypothetical protein
MFEREIMIAGLRKQEHLIRELVEELEEKPRLFGNDLRYCEEVMKKIEQTLKKLRRSDHDYAKYHS